MKKEVIKGCEGRGDADSPYLTRYTLIETRWFKLCLHIFHRSDADELHDHPWNFWSLILWRGYIEQTAGGRRRVWPGMLLRRRAEHAHRVVLLKGLSYAESLDGLNDPWEAERPAVTLVLMTKRRREWGFFTTAGWQQWRSYFKSNGC